MKNKVNWMELVPVEDRIKTYEKAIEIMRESQIKSGSSEGICLTVPIIYWNLKDAHSKINGKLWVYRNVQKSFPEITEKRTNSVSWEVDKLTRTKQRIKILQRCIKDCNKIIENSQKVKD